MTIEKKINQETATLIVSGRLDTQTAPELENEMLNRNKAIVAAENAARKKETHKKQNMER